MPPFRGLYALVQIARHGRFDAAADRLNVTASAVSHQLKVLESWIGARLLDRRTRSPALTPIGQRLIEGIEPAFSRIEEACVAAKRGSDLRKVVLSCTTDFASFLLMPLLPSFWQEHPEVDVDVRLTRFDAPPATSSADISVRFLHDADIGVALGPTGWSVVCSHAYFESLEKPAHLGDIQSGELYHEASYNYWPKCFALANLAVPKGVIYRGIGGTGHILSAVMGGEGLALAPKALTHRLVDSGLLVTAFDVEIEKQATYVALTEREAVRKPAADLLLTWLIANLGASESRVVRTDSSATVLS